MEPILAVKYCTFRGCFIVSCDAGQQPSSDGQFCEDCPVGSYKDTTGTAACTSCPDGEITDQSGSTSASDCQGWCFSDSTVYYPVIEHTQMLR